MAEQFNAEQKMLSYRTAQIVSMIAEVNRDHKKRPKPFKPEDFMPKEKSKVLSGDELAKRVETINTTLGGDVK